MDYKEYRESSPLDKLKDSECSEANINLLIVTVCLILVVAFKFI